MISVIIPVLNESETIGSVVALALRDPLVTEVIVVDDGSIDGTPALAEAAGAKVVTSTLLGKGASMEDGMRAAQNEILLYLDGDLRDLREDVVSAMTRPIREEGAEFVKAKFSRAAGRVTTLTAKPLIQVFFPELAGFDQPLAGIIAARKSLLKRLRFENDYGVDVGLLIDASAAGAKLAQVDIGRIEHDSHPLEVLGDMATQVMRTILECAGRCGRLRLTHMREVAEVERQMQEELAIAIQRMGKVDRLAIFDMDGTLLDGRFVVALAKRANRMGSLTELLDNDAILPDDRTKQIARLFRGVPREVFEEAARSVPLIPGAAETVIGLRRMGYRVGIVTDSYRIAAETIRRRIFADFSIAHLMRFRQGKASGEVTLSRAMAHPHGCPQHTICKANAALHLIDNLGINASQVLAIGDGDNDVCLLRNAGTSIAFQPKTPRVRAAAHHLVVGDLRQILSIIEPNSAKVTV